MNEEPFSKIAEPIALVVDDEPLILMNTSYMVAEDGYPVIEVSTADEAYAFLSKLPSLQLLFTDVQMPGDLNGFDLAHRVAKQRPHVRVVITSGGVIPEEGDIPGTAMFLQKPLSASLIHETLENHCEVMKAERSE